MLAAQTKVELRLLFRRGESVLVTLAVPALLLIFFSTVAVLPALAAGDAGAAPIQALLPGVLALAVMSTSMVSLGIATGYERSYGVLKRLGGTPLPRSVLLGAKILSVLVVEALQVCLLVVLGLALGWHPVGQWGVALVVLVLGTGAFAGLGLWMAGSWRAEAVLAGANGLYLAMLLLGGIIVPVERLPAALASIAALLPSAALATCLRHALAPGPGIDAGAVLVLFVWAIGAPLLAWATFKWE
jgi:ABC-2 type transport system permease protein